MGLATRLLSFDLEGPMTLLNSLYSAVNGLQAQSYSMSNTSNNLSNASTTAFKDSTTSFEDIVFACDTKSSSYTGTCGALASTTNHNDAQGTITSSLTSTNLAINGKGYFPVQTAVVTAADTPGGVVLTTTFDPDMYYTRAGDFAMNASGYMENGNGYYLMGYAVDPATGTTGTTLLPVNINTTLLNATIPTTALDYAANLNADVPAGTTASSSSVNIYASDYNPTLNNTHAISYTWQKAGTNLWTLNVASAGGNLGVPYTASIPVSFDTSGNINAIGAGTGNYTITGNTISFGLNYVGATPQTITCDLSGMTQFASSSISAIVADVAGFTQNGVPQGSYSGIEIDSSGNIAVDFSNGITATYYKVCVATFVNSDDLQALSGNAYKSTIASGDATYTTAGLAGAGTLEVGSLEMSNVDIADEFSTMIKTQQVYSANAKVVSTVNAMMQTLIQLQSA